MIKKVIFDLDDTLIINSTNCSDNYGDVLKQFGLESSISELYYIVGEYETRTKKYDRQELLDLINNHYNSNLLIEFVDAIIDAVGKWSYPASEDTINTLDYLSNKYELYVLTNWFHKSQVERLSTAGILKYCKEVRSAEIVTKPYKEAFEQFFDDCNPEECVMIGDNYKIDIEVPNELGMKTILCNFKNKQLDYDGKIITDFKELVDIL